MRLHIIGIDEDPEVPQPSQNSILKAAQAYSAAARSRSQLLQKLDALRGIMPVNGTRRFSDLPFKLLDSIRDDTQRLMSDVSPYDQFWTSAGDILIDIVNIQSPIGQSVHAIIAAGGDIEIAAHNEPGRISLTLVERSGARKVLMDSRRQAINHQSAA
jgi:hypothetical protein